MTFLIQMGSKKACGAQPQHQARWQSSGWATVFPKIYRLPGLCLSSQHIAFWYWSVSLPRLCIPGA